VGVGCTRKAYRFFALELDRGTMPVVRQNTATTSVTGKLIAYGHFIAAGGPRRVLGIPNLFVLTVTSSAARVVNLIAGAKGNESASWFLFKAVEGGALREPHPGLLVEAWERAGLPMLSIADSN
jgi:hypothetical protein